MPIKTFRGKIASGVQDTIVLHTNNGSTGYRIKNLQVIDSAPGANTVEIVVKVFSVEQSSINGTIDFSESTLLAVAYYGDNAGSQNGNEVGPIIFDNVIFNQDIYVTAVELANATASNYYIELEQIKLDLNENTVATLKDIRNVTAPT
jgi:hypothetical protein